MAAVEFSLLILSQLHQREGTQMRNRSTGVAFIDDQLFAPQAADSLVKRRGEFIKTAQYQQRAAPLPS